MTRSKRRWCKCERVKLYDEENKVVWDRCVHTRSKCTPILIKELARLLNRVDEAEKEVARAASPIAPAAAEVLPDARKRHPKIDAHIVCSECRAPFVLRRGHSITQGCAVVWVWQRDCKHKKAAPFAVEGS